ncbi:hypothetical protein HY58_01510 [Flavihumibacter sp. ZG627]|nr:hypothetical protein HY58_01510 [Flavihumibacter sp. ZG627]
MLVSLFSCRASKQAKKDMLYLNNGTLDTLPNKQVKFPEAVIQKGDQLSITVYSDNPEATLIFNQQTARVTTGTSTAGANAGGYQVDQQGMIRIQTIGAIQAAGMTRNELAIHISDKLKPYLMNPFTDVRFLNPRITVIGEVQKPGVIIMPTEKISILEVIGLAGDVTMYGRKENVLVIRESNGVREFGRLDLRNTNIFQSPYYFLQQNDIVMVESNTKKQTATDQENMRKLTLVTTFATLVSTIAILVTLFR